MLKNISGTEIVCKQTEKRHEKAEKTSKSNCSLKIEYFFVKMFEQPDWDDDVSCNLTEFFSRFNYKIFLHFQIPKKVKKDSLKTLSSSLKRKIEKSISSPSLTQNLIEDHDDGTPKKKAKTENILTKGIKFASEQDFVKFMTMKEKKSEKRRLKKSNTTIELSNNAKNGNTDTNTKSENSKKFHIGKLKEIFKKDQDKNESVNEDSKSNPHKMKLQSAHFRHLNEKLYTQSGSHSLKMFQKDPDAFKVYHEGFMTQASKWPVDPLAKIITALMKM